MVEVVERLRDYATARTPVVFVGETGTGKTYFARLLHQLSGREGDLTEASAGEIRPELAESIIYGHVRGAFTGAVYNHPGLFTRAGTGTLLFDDFHLLRRWVQYLLLAPLDTGKYLPLGAKCWLPLGCRLVIGMGEHPDVLVARRRLLADLRYRLEHCIITLPRLEERREEIAALAARFLREAPARTKVIGGPVRLSPEAVAAFEAGSYPGNLRDLRGIVNRAYLRGRSASSEVVSLEHLPVGMHQPLRFDRRGDHAAQLRAVSWALGKTGGRVGEAARLIGASRNKVGSLRAELMASHAMQRKQVGEGNPCR